MSRILVIDDSVSVLEWVAEVLRRVCHDVLIADDGADGLKRLRENPVELIITDIYMPNKDGLEVIQQARQTVPGLKIIAMSTRPAKRNMFDAARALGAARTLQKPFSEEQLLEVVASVLAPQAEASAAGKPVCVRLGQISREPDTALPRVQLARPTLMQQRSQAGPWRQPGNGVSI